MPYNCTHLELYYNWEFGTINVSNSNKPESDEFKYYQKFILWRKINDADRYNYEQIINSLQKTVYFITYLVNSSWTVVDSAVQPSVCRKRNISVMRICGQQQTANRSKHIHNPYVNTEKFYSPFGGKSSSKR